VQPPVRAVEKDLIASCSQHGKVRGQDGRRTMVATQRIVRRMVLRGMLGLFSPYTARLFPQSELDATIELS
jgi:hypothetical protein